MKGRGVGEGTERTFYAIRFNRLQEGEGREASKKRWHHRGSLKVSQTADDQDSLGELALAVWEP